MMEPFPYQSITMENLMYGATKARTPVHHMLVLTWTQRERDIHVGWFVVRPNEDLCFDVPLHLSS